MIEFNNIKALLSRPWLWNRRVQNLNDLKRHSKIYHAKLVTIDVFDTALLRIVSHPDDVYTLASWRAKERYDLKDDVGELVKKRKLAEKIALSSPHSHKLDQVSLGNIFHHYDYFDHEKIKLIHDEELNTERDVCTSNKAILDIFNHLTEAGIRVAFLSDTVFSGDFIKERLIAAGYKGPLEVYVSSEFGLSKATGLLFDTIASHVGIRPNEIWHIGDNVQSDVFNAKRAGFNALWYSSNLRIHNITRPIGATEDEIQSSILNGIRTAAKLSAEFNPNTLVTIGFDIIGPFFLGFTQWSIKGIKESGSSKVYFLARDAFSIKHFYDRLSLTETLPPSFYLYVSRRSLIYPNIKYLDDERLNLLCNSSRPIPLGEFFERIGFSAAELNELDLNDGVDLNFVIDNRKSNELEILKRCFRSFEEKLLGKFSEERILLRKYLDKCEFGKENRTAICDIGYSATSQRALATYLSEYGLGSYLSGFYMYTANWVDDDQMGGSTIGWMEDRGEFKFDINFMELSWALMDFFCGAPHGTTLGYANGPDGIQPVLKKLPVDDEIAGAQRQIQEGARHFLDAYMRAFGGLRPIAVDPKRVIGDLARLIRYPTLGEAESLGGLTWIEGLGSTSSGTKFAEPPSLIAALLNPWLFVNAYKNTLWRSGFVVRFFRSRWLARIMYP